MDGPNRYPFVKNNPMNFVNPEGEASLLIQGCRILSAGAIMCYSLTQFNDCIDDNEAPCIRANPGNTQPVKDCQLDRCYEKFMDAAMPDYTGPVKPKVPKP